MIENSNARLNEYRRNLIAVNRSFSSMEPLMLRTKYLSLNAEIASAHVGEAGNPFGIVVRELANMGGKLSEIIKEVESQFSMVVEAVDRWIEAERRMELYLRSYRLANEALDDESLSIVDSMNDLSIYNEKTLTAWGEVSKRFTRGSAQENLLGNIIKCRNEVVGHMRTIIDLTGKLSGLIDRVNMVAVRQSHFVAVTALIESVQVTDARGQIKTIAQDIQTLSREIHAVENGAKNKILSVAALASTILSKIK